MSLFYHIFLMLTLENFSVSRESKSIITNISQVFKSSTTVVIQGDNGSGKSTFVSAIMGHAGYDVAGNILLDNESIVQWPLEKRAQAGIFLSYQHPVEIPGLSIKTFLQHAYRACHKTSLSLDRVEGLILDACAMVGLSPEYALKNVHEGFSGGQKKRLELVQMLVLKPRIVMLDELDSGLDAHGIEMLISCLELYKKICPESLFIIITHNTVLAQRCSADMVLVMKNGVFSGA